MDNQRRLRREREKKRRRIGWIFLANYGIIILIIAFYLGPNLNLFVQILFIILSIVVFYLSNKIFFKKKKTRISFDRRY